MTTSRNGEISLIPIIASILLVGLITAAFGFVYAESASQYSNKTYNSTVIDSLGDATNSTEENVNQTKQEISEIDANANLLDKIISVASLIYVGAWTALNTLINSFTSLFTIITVGVSNLPVGQLGAKLISFLITVSLLALIAVLLRVALKRRI